MKLTWATDTHLNYIALDKAKEFCDSIKLCEPDAVVITGDISESSLLFYHLLMLEKELDPTPVFFVCGNHDYYHGSITEIRNILRDRYTYPDYEKGGLYKGAYWLGSSGVIPLTKTAALIGHDGWYDGGYADYFKSRLDMNDYYLIHELTATREFRYQTIRMLAQESANYLKNNLYRSFHEGFDVVYVATHVPPFRENSTYNGKISDDDWMPHFSSKIMGDMLLETAKNNPDKNIVVLCGHSHGGATHKPLPNLVVHTGKAKYKRPEINTTFVL